MGFLKHHPVTSPPANQRIVHELIRHPVTLSLMLSLETLPWKPSESWGLLSLSCPFSLPGSPLNAILSFTTPQCQLIGFAVCWANGHKFDSVTVHTCNCITRSFPKGTGLFPKMVSDLSANQSLGTGHEVMGYYRDTTRCLATRMRCCSQNME